MNTTARAAFATAVAGALALGIVALAAAEPDGLARRRAEVARRGEQVMGFDPDRTTHRFTPVATGGVETVTADDPGDTGEIARIRTHLEFERGRFESGDFDDPMAIHGHAMPGLDVLRTGARAGRLRVAYGEVAGGGRLAYASGDAEVVAAIHRWFEAQVADHGAHSTR
jgi:hypothetical protein